MRVVFLADSISTQRAGIHFYGRQLIRQMQDQYPDHTYSAVVSEHLPYLDIEQIVVPISESIPQHLRLRQMSKIPKLINDIDPDIAIELAHFGPFRLKKHIRRITVIHDLTPITYPQFHSTMSTVMHQRLMPGVMQKATSIIANSQHTLSEINRMYKVDTERIHVVYPKLYKTYTDDQVDEYETIVGDSNFILSVGTIEPRKDYVTLIKAFDRIAERFPSYKLVIAGQSGWKNQAFFTTLEGLSCKDRIIVTGYVNRKTLNSLYTHAQLYANASIAEGFGLPILEAMSYGTPMVLSDIPTYREITGSTANFFDVGNVDMAADKLLYTLSTLTPDVRDQIHNRYKAYKNESFVLPFMEV